MALDQLCAAKAMFHVKLKTLNEVNLKCLDPHRNKSTIYDVTAIYPSPLIVGALAGIKPQPWGSELQYGASAVQIWCTLTYSGIAGVELFGTT